ncbi:MAG: hypothetical protein WAW37_18000 [Syntrophobacteraceae bacterium]
MGEQKPDSSFPLSIRIKHQIKRILKLTPSKRVFGGQTPDGKRLYVSGTYSEEEMSQIRSEYTWHLREISEHGVLALHLTHGTPRPFQQHFFPALGKWLDDNEFSLTFSNYVPFYFVYALLRGKRKAEILDGRRALVVHGARGHKKDVIIRSLREEGVREIFWAAISESRSWFDNPDPEPYIGRVDLCLVGAGVGKPRVLNNLAVLNVPCIDAGYVFEVWADPAVAPYRPFILPDHDPRSREMAHLNKAERATFKKRLDLRQMREDGK